MIDPAYRTAELPLSVPDSGVPTSAQTPNYRGQLILNRTPFTVIGVMPESFRGMDHDARPDVFLPLESEPSIDAPFNSIAAGYRVWWMWIGARLKDGVSPEQAAAMLKANSFAMTHGKETPLRFKLSGYKLEDLYITAERGWWILHGAVSVRKTSASVDGSGEFGAVSRMPKSCCVAYGAGGCTPP